MVVPQQQTLPGVLFSSLEHSDNVALVAAGGGAQLTFAQLEEQVAAVGAQLLSVGVKRGDLVSLTFSNTLEFVISFLAVTRIRAIAAPLNAAYTEDEFRFYIEDAGASLLLVPLEGNTAAEAAATSLHIPIASVSSLSASRNLSVTLKNEQSSPTSTAHDAGALPDPSDDALFLHTSGTTSRPKGVPLTHGNLAASIGNIRATYSLTQSDRTLVVMPLFHVHGLMAALLTTLAAGGTAVLPKAGRFSASTFWGDITAHGCTWYTAVPTIHQILLQLHRKSPLATEQRPVLRFIRSCSSPLAPAVLEELEAAFGAPVLEAYAMTEASHQMTANPLPEKGPHKAGTVGKATGIELAILDDDNQPLPPGEIGEVSIRGPNVTSGYRNNPAANESAFAGGWFHTGDRGFLDGDGYLTLTGRIKELINRGGEKINPNEIDAALLSHPSVSEAVAFSAPDPKYGEVVNVAVVPAAGSTVTADSVIDHAKQRLASFKIPVRVFIADSMPRTATGKIQRRKVAEHFLGGVGDAAAGPSLAKGEGGPGPGKAEGVAKAGAPAAECSASTKVVADLNGAAPGVEGRGTVDGAALAARALAKAGVRYMFGVVGIPVTSLATHVQQAGIRFIGMRNEQPAGYAASAVGYLTGTLGALLTVSGPGAVHGLAGLSNAMANCWPMVMVSGSCPKDEIGRGGFQELDQIAAVRPFVKYAGQASTIGDIPSVVAAAVAEAVKGRPGPTYVDLPANVLHEEVSEALAEKLLSQLATLPPVGSPAYLTTAPKAAPEAVAKAVALLRSAQRPLVVVGKGAAYARAEVVLREFVEETGIPFLPTPIAKGILPDDHPLSATAARSLVLSESDVVLVVGARLNWILHFGEPPRWGAGVKFIQIDIDADELALRRPEVAVLSDAAVAVGQIKAELAAQQPRLVLSPEHPWVAKVAAKVAANLKRAAGSRLDADIVPLNFQCTLRVIRDALASLSGPAPMIVSEGANTMDVARTMLDQKEPRTRLDAGTWGTMGVGMGYSAAAAVVGGPEQLVVAVEGDSAFGFSGLEVEVLVRYKLPVVVIVFNNNGIYGGDRRGPVQIDGPAKDDPAPTSFVPDARYDLVMEAFGGKGYLVRTPEELAAACKEAFALKQPALLNVIIDPLAGGESGRLHARN